MTTDNMFTQKLTQSQKDADDKQWYKDNIDRLDLISGRFSFTFQGVDDKRRKSVNYNLMNNIININDFEYVCAPYGAQAGELPAEMTNRDIVSGKINALLGWEMKRPFTWRVVATNPEALSRREQEEAERIKRFVVAQILEPVRMEIQQRKIQELEGRQPSQEEIQKIRQEIQEELDARTPPEVRKYMKREHQDMVEILGQRILNYLFEKQELNRKFNEGWKHALLSGEEIYYVTDEGNGPIVKTINSKYFDCDRNTETPYVHERQWAGVEYWLSPEEVIARWGDELNDEDIDDLYSGFFTGGTSVSDSDFSFDDSTYDETAGKIRCVHRAWRSLKKIGFLTYVDPDGNEQERIVSESYKVNKPAGDLKIEWTWIPEVHEGIKIGRDKYVRMRPVPYQHKDLNDLTYAPLPFIGAVYSDTNSTSVALMDRMKAYQYYYNIIMYRIEVLMATDLGKIAVGDVTKVARSMGMDISKFMYYAAANRVTWVNPSEEGNRGDMNVTNLFKELDLSNTDQIRQYIELAEYIERRCGESVGIPKQIEAQISPTEAVTNVQQQIIQSSNLLEPYFDLHNNVKKHVLSQLLEVAKASYALDPPDYLVYTLDDLSLEMLNLSSNVALLDNASFGVFVSNAAKDSEVMNLIQQLGHAAMQTQSVELSDIIKLYRSTNIAEAEEELADAEERKRTKDVETQKQAAAQAKEIEAMRQETEDKQHKNRLDEIRVKEEERRKTELQKQAMLSAGFNQDKDMDNDGIPDVLELYRSGKDAQIENRKLDIEQQKVDIERQKVKQDAKKKE